VAEPQVARWGSTKTERRACWPGDELVDDPGLVWTNAVTIDRPASEVWPWIAQLGQGRGGLYSYDWLENLLGCDVHSARRVLPQFQEPLPVGADVAGLAGPLMVFAVPRPALRARPRPGPATGARGRHPPGRSVPPLDRRMVGWHVPGAYELALEHRWAHDPEHASMVLAGLLAWVSVMAAAPRRRMRPRTARQLRGRVVRRRAHPLAGAAPVRPALRRLRRAAAPPARPHARLPTKRALRC
jgi:hypothetical protein